MYFADGVPPVGISRHTGATGYPFFFFGDLHTYSCGKYWNDPFNQDWFPTSHTHVLLPGNLSFVGVCYSSTITPKMLADIFIGEENHLLCWLLSADVLLYSLGTNECILFGWMARDRYAAICNPLLYALIVSRTVCLKAAAGAFTAGLVNSVVHTGYVSSLSLCSSDGIHHLFCNTLQLLSSHVLIHTCMKASCPLLLVWI